MQPWLSSANVTIVKMNFSSSVSMLAPKLNPFLRSKPVCVSISQTLNQLHAWSKESLG